MTPASGSASNVTYEYLRTPGATSTDHGFRLNGDVLQTNMGASNWQDLTDRSTVRITAFNVSSQREPPLTEPPLRVPCPNDCLGGGNACWPTVTVRELVVTITGQSATDPAVQRSLRTTVRLRNDEVEGACP
jgi:hypothetical protein